MNFTPFFIALRYARAKSGDRFGRLVGNLAALGIMLGVMALVVVLSVMNGLENMQKRNVLEGLPHAVVAPLGKNWQKTDRLPLPEGVIHSVPFSRANVVIQSRQGMNAGVLIGVEQPQDDPLLREFASLQPLLPTGGFNVLLSTRLAEQLNVREGDKIRLMITENSQYTPFGRVPVQRLFNVAGVYFSPSQSSEFTLFANLRDVGRLLRLNEGESQGVRLFLADPFQVTELAAHFPAEQWQISDWREQKGEFFQAVRMEKNMMGLLVSLIIIVAVSNIVTSLSLMVVDKQGEIAILQTQGLSKRQVTQIFIVQGALVGVFGTLLGALLGVFVALNLGDLLMLFNPNGIPLPSEIDYRQVATIVLSALVLSLLCTLYPAYRAAKVEPADALRYE